MLDFDKNGEETEDDEEGEESDDDDEAAEAPAESINSNSSEPSVEDGQAAASNQFDDLQSQGRLG